MNSEIDNMIKEGEIEFSDRIPVKNVYSTKAGRISTTHNEFKNIKFVSTTKDLPANKPPHDPQILTKRRLYVKNGFIASLFSHSHKAKVPKISVHGVPKSDISHDMFAFRSFF